MDNAPKWHIFCWGCACAYGIYPDLLTGQTIAHCSAQNNKEIPTCHPTVDCKFYKESRMEKE